MNRFLRVFPKSLLAGVILAGKLWAQESYVAVEAHSGKVLLELNADTKRPVASLTKIATGMVLLDWAKASGTSMGTYALVPQEAAYLGGSNPMGLAPGDRITLREAMYSMLLGSDNVAALTLADHAGRSIMTRGSRERTPVAAFVVEMNNLARAIGMNRTRFANPHGMDTARQRGTSTARDMAALSIYAMRNTGFQYYVKQKERIVASSRLGQKRAFRVKNTHNLIGQKGINGIKTGTTVLAGPCLATSAQKPNIVRKMPRGRTLLTPRRLIVICLGSPDREGRTNQLIEQAWPLYDNWMAQGRPTQNAQREIISVPKL
ncbi:MAG: D-alanyl-D-alanine carboxypeptidase family protein [Akkermansiaceae bacterium]